MLECTQRISEESADDKHQVGTLYILGTAYPVFTGVNNVGRDTRTSDIFIDDPTVSQSHAVIRVSNHQHIILDLGSTNRTILDYAGALSPYDQYVLKHKCTLKFGNVEGQYFYDDMELESEACNSPTARPSNPLGKVFENSVEAANVSDDGIPGSPILGSSSTNRRLKSSKSSIDTAKISLFELETQPSTDRKDSLPKSTDDSNHGSFDRLILSESLPENRESFCVPETQQVVDSTLGGLQISVEESDHDITKKSSNLCDPELSEIISYQEDSNSSVSDIISSQCLLRSFSDVSKPVEETEVEVARKTEKSKSDDDLTDCEEFSEVLNSKAKASDGIDNDQYIPILNKETEGISPTHVNSVTLQVSQNSSELYQADTQLIAPDIGSNITAQNVKSIEKNKPSDLMLDVSKIHDLELLQANTQLVTSVVDTKIISKSVKLSNSIEKDNTSNLRVDATKIHDLEYYDAPTQKIPFSRNEELWDFPTQKVPDVHKSDDLFDQPTQLISNISITEPITDIKKAVNKKDSSNISRKSKCPKVSTENSSTKDHRTSVRNNSFKNHSVSDVSHQSSSTSKLKLTDDSISDKTTIILSEASICSESVPEINKNDSNVDINKHMTNEVIENFNISTISDIVSDVKSNLGNKIPIPISSTPMIENKKSNTIELLCNKSYNNTLLHHSISDDSMEDSEAERMAENSMKMDLEAFPQSIASKQIFGSSSDSETNDSQIDSEQLKNRKRSKKKRTSSDTSSINHKNSKTMINLFGNEEEDINHEASTTFKTSNLKDKMFKGKANNQKDEITKEYSKSIKNDKIIEVPVGNLRTTRSNKSSNVDKTNHSSEKSQNNIMFMKNNNEIASEGTKLQQLSPKISLENIFEVKTKFYDKDLQKVEAQNSVSAPNIESLSFKQRKSTRKRTIEKHVSEIVNSSTTSKKKKGRNSDKKLFESETFSKDAEKTMKKVISEKENGGNAGSSNSEILVSSNSVDISTSKKNQSSQRKSKRQINNSKRIVSQTTQNGINSEESALSLQSSNTSPRRSNRKPTSRIQVLTPTRINQRNESSSVQEVNLQKSHEASEQKANKIELSDNELVSSSSNRIHKQKKHEELSTKGTIKSESNFKILITSVIDDSLPELITALGGTIIEDHKCCSVLIAPRIVRTVKFLCCLGKGIPIVSVDWIIQSSKAEKFLDPWDYITVDKAGEAKYRFDLKKSLRRAQSNPLLKGYTVMGTKSILPQPKETRDIVTSCGGTFVNSVPRGGFKDPAFIISCDEDKKSWPKGNERKHIPCIVKIEALLSGILQQKLHLELYILRE